MSDGQTIGFIGLGVMGEPMCGNLLAKSGAAIVAYDISPAPMERLRAAGAAAGSSVADVARRSDVVFLSLPGGAQVSAVCEGEEGLLARARPGQTIVDLSTSPVSLARDLARRPMFD